MLSKRTKTILYLLLAVLFGIALCILGCIRFNTLSRISNDGEQLPVKSFRITINQTQREELFEQFRRFAEKHEFEIQINDYGTGGESYLIWMSREDITINASITRHDPKIVSVGFFAKYPGYPINEETFDKLVKDMKSFLSEIPNVVITEEP